MVMTSAMLMIIEEPLFVVLCAGGDVGMIGYGCRKWVGGGVLGSWDRRTLGGVLGGVLNLHSPNGGSRCTLVGAFGGVLNWGGNEVGVHKVFGIMCIPPPAGTFGGTLTRMSFGTPEGS